MNLSKAWKIAIGVATLFFSLAPFLILIPLFVLFLTLAARNPQPEPAMVLFFIGIVLPLSFVLAGLQFLLFGFYTYHLVKNREGSDNLRTILGIDNLIFPYLSLPLYYFIFIWPEQIPEWSRQSRFTGEQDG